jgi:hypothetical protein
MALFGTLFTKEEPVDDQIRQEIEELERNFEVLTAREQDFEERNAYVAAGNQQQLNSLMVQLKAMEQKLDKLIQIVDASKPPKKKELL